MADPQLPKPETLFLRDFTGGVNLSASRESIEDNECWWLEGAFPLAPGNLAITPGATASFGGWGTAASGETGAPSYMVTFNIAGADYLFVVWSNSGNGYIGPLNGIGISKIFTGTLTSGTTSAAQWNNQGVLIIDPTGYWDWNVTAATTLTALSQSVQSITVTDPGTGYSFGSLPTVSLTGGSGSGATISNTPYIGVVSVAITGAGSNYKVGDVLQKNWTLSNIVPATIVVTTVNATGGITGVSIQNAGEGVGYTSTYIGGGGTGATFTDQIGITGFAITNAGHGYSSAPTVSFSGGGAPSRAAKATVNVSGFLGGTLIATYAGRAWMANGRTITFTDAGSYTSFIGSGSQFTIEDDYLHDTITALFATNAYLYIFGVDSIDVLSNVTVTAADTASFSRVNITGSVGCAMPMSLFSYQRSVAFAGADGFYFLSGATPEKISEKLGALIPQMDFTNIANISGGQVTVVSNTTSALCAAWKIVFNDTFTGQGAGNTMLVIYYKGKWHFSRQAFSSGFPLTLGPVVSIPNNPLYMTGSTIVLYTIASDKSLYSLFSNTSTPYWRVWTKLYDFGKPMFTKQATRTALGLVMGGTVANRNGLNVTVDTESTAPGQTTALLTGTFTGYTYFTGGNTQGNGQFLGLEVNANSATQADVTQIRWLALQAVPTTQWRA